MKAHSSSRIVLATTLLALLATNTGCTIVGMGVGASIGDSVHSYSTVAPDDPLPAAGREVRVRVASPGSTEDRVNGRYAGVCDGALIVRNDSGEHAIALDAIRELRVSDTDLRTGLAIGGAVGAMFDLALLAFAAALGSVPRK